MESKQDSKESISSASDLRLLDDLIRTEVRLYAAADARLRAACGQGLGRYDALQTIADIPGCRVSDLVRRLGITIGAASKGADRQVRDGYVSRTANPDDGRSSFLALTPAGETLLGELRAALAGILSELLAETGIDRAELAALGGALHRLRRALEAL